MSILIPSIRRTGERTRRNRKTHTVRIETLESRVLLSAITSYPTGATDPVGITQDNSGNIWLADNTGLYKIGPDGTQIGSAMATSYSPYDVVFDAANGHLYFSDPSNNAIVEVGLDGTVLHAYTVPNPDSETPGLLMAAPDGSIWFTTGGLYSADGNSYSAELGRIDLSGNMTFGTLTDPNTQPIFITAAPDGTIWFDTSGVGGSDGSIIGNSEIGMAHANSDGSVSIDNMWAISTPGALTDGMAVASDGSVWFAVGNRGAGVPGPADGPDGIVNAVYSNGNLTQTEYVLPGATTSSSVGPGGVGIDSSGRVWFTEGSPGALSYLDSATGDITEMAVPATVGYPINLVVSSTDVWASALDGTDTLMHVDLSTFASPLTASTPAISATAGQEFTGSLLTFQTADDGPYTYSIDYGNGQTASGSIDADGSGSYTIPADVTYADAGAYNISVVISTADGNTVSALGEAMVVPSVGGGQVVAQGVDVSGVQDVKLPRNMMLRAEQVVVATFTGPTATYSASIDWGDGTTSTGKVVNLGNNMYAVKVPAGDKKIYTSNGTFNGTVTISGGPNVATASFTATISDTPLVVITVNLPNFKKSVAKTVTVAKFTDDIESTTAWFTATINWGDGTTSVGVITAVLGKPGKYTVTGTHTYAATGTYTVVTLIDNTVEDDSSSISETVLVNK